MPYLSEKFLKSRLGLDGAPGSKIKNDLPCAGCDYNLRGLTYGRACPECGQTIRRNVELGPKDDLIGRGDPEFRRRMQIGFGLASGCLLFALVARWLSFVFALFILGETSSIYHLAILFNSVLWAVGVWLMTPREIDRLWPKLMALRWGVRITQCIWPLALGAYAYTQLVTVSMTLDEQLLSYQATGRFIAGGGVFLLLWLMHTIAQGAELEKAAKRIYITFWGLPFFTILASLFPDTFLWIYLAILVMLLVGWSWMMSLFALALLEMSKHAGWSLRYMQDQVDRDNRILEKRAELQKESEKRIRTVSDNQARDISLDS